MKSKVIILSTLLISLVLIVSGCGNKTSTYDKSDSSSSNHHSDEYSKRDSSEPRNEDEIAADIIENKFYREEYSRFTISDLSIIKRQTDTDNKTDKIFVSLAVVNGNETLDGYKANTIQGNVDLILTYGLYNDGWILDSCEIDEDGQYGAGTFLAQEGLDLTEEQLKNIMVNEGYSADYITVNDYQFDLEHQTGTYSIHACKKYAYLTEDYDVFVTCIFVGEKDAEYLGSLSTWIFLVNGGFVIDESWNIEGTYRDENSGGIVYIPYTEPVDNMQLDFAGAQIDFGALVDASELSLKNLAAALNSSAEDYISLYNYSVCFWDGQDTNYTKISYSNFDYITAYFYTGMTGRAQYRYFILIGPDRIAHIDDNAVTIDTVDHIVYVKVDELIPVD